MLHFVSFLNIFALHHSLLYQTSDTLGRRTVNLLECEKLDLCLSSHRHYDNSEHSPFDTMKCKNVLQYKSRNTIGYDPELAGNEYKNININICRLK